MKAFFTRLKSYWFSRLLWKYFGMILALIAVPVVVLNILWISASNASLENEMFSLNEQSLLRSAGMMDSAVQSISDLAYSLAVSNDVTGMSFYTREEMGRSGNYKSVVSAARLLYSTYEYVDSIDVYYARARAVISRKEALHELTREEEDSDWMRAYRANPGRQYVAQVPMNLERYPWIFSVVCPIGNKVVGGFSGAGAVAVHINMKKLGEYLGFGYYRREGEQPLLVAWRGDDLFYLDERRLLRDERDDLSELEALRGRVGSFSQRCRLWGTEFVVSGFYSKDSGLQYAYLSPVTRYVQRARSNRSLSLISALVSVALSFLTAFVLALLGSGPIIDLTRELEGGYRSEDEMQFIRDTMLSIQSQNSQLRAEMEQRMVSLKRAQLAALQAQINPHFLYNTLMSVSGAVARVTGPESTEVGVLETFASLMRTGLNNTSFLVPLSEEVEHIRLFSRLVEFRYRGRASVTIDVPDELMSACLPKLSLQPLVENAIEHGLRPKHYYGRIEITAGEENGLCRVRVKDNGAGMSPEREKELRAWLSGVGIERVEHLGLKNVHQRLRLIFGDRAGVQIHISPGCTEFDLVFPLLPMRRAPQ